MGFRAYGVFQLMSGLGLRVPLKGSIRDLQGLTSQAGPSSGAGSSAEGSDLVILRGGRRLGAAGSFSSDQETGTLGGSSARLSREPQCGTAKGAWPSKASCSSGSETAKAVCPFGAGARARCPGPVNNAMIG